MATDLNDLEVFVEVVNAGSFSAAARARGTPASSVSRRVARLERRLGVRLLERTTRRLRLTDAGTIYYERGSGLLEELADAERQLAELQATPRGRVRIAAPMEHTVTLRLITQFLAQHDDVRVELFLTNRPVDLVEEGYDLSIHPGALTDSTSIVAFKLMESPFRLVAAPSYLRARGEPRTAAELERHDTIVFGQSLETEWAIAGAEGTERVRVRARLAVNHLHAVSRAALCGLGIAMLPAAMCQEDLDAGRLRRVLPEASLVAVPIWVTYLGGRHMTPAVRAFVDFAKERFVPIMNTLRKR